ncbi:Lrp/AsnC family transcriptional regulator [Streptomyces sp. BI20]|uniref:Lrp/AsnC family transcriptional regulator n=1 Tax=Streptomyces sp. BI20 TaxID=3403460 RepID=UPI003C74203F
MRLDPLDSGLIHALQIAPRASWQLLGEVLAVDPATVSRRWERLRSSGRAWVTAYPNPWTQSHFEIAFLEIDCDASAGPAAARALAELPQVASVEHLAGGCDLLVTTFAADMESLSELVLERIARLPGVTDTRTRLVTRVYGDGSRWRMRRLSPAQERQLARAEPARVSGEGARVPDLTEQRLLGALSVDGRQSASDLRPITGLGTDATRRRVNRLLTECPVMLRCDVARELTEWPVSATLWARVPAARLEATARGLLSLPEVRMCVAVTGTSNLLISVWLRSVADVQRLETQLAERLPEVVLVDRAIAMRQIKRMGRLLGPGGRAVGAVPLNAWGSVNHAD